MVLEEVFLHGDNAIQSELSSQLIIFNVGNVLRSMILTKLVNKRSDIAKLIVKRAKGNNNVSLNPPITKGLKISSWDLKKALVTGT